MIPAINNITPSESNAYKSLSPVVKVALSVGTVALGVFCMIAAFPINLPPLVGAAIILGGSMILAAAVFSYFDASALPRCPLGPQDLINLKFRAICAEWKLEQVRDMLEKKEVSAEQCLSTAYGFSPLETAVIQNRVNFVKLFLKHLPPGVNIHLPNRDGNTLLHVALVMDHEEIAQLFLDRPTLPEIDINLPNRLGLTPLDRAIRLRHGASIVNSLLNHMSRRDALPTELLFSCLSTVLILAIENEAPGPSRENRVNTVKALLKHIPEGINVNHYYLVPGLTTYLHRIASIGNMELAEVFAERLRRIRANANPPNGGGTTPAQIARYLGYFEIAELLDRPTSITAECAVTISSVAQNTSV